jgi:hypothetical protein
MLEEWRFEEMGLLETVRDKYSVGIPPRCAELWAAIVAAREDTQAGQRHEGGTDKVTNRDYQSTTTTSPASVWKQTAMYLGFPCYANDQGVQLFYNVARNTWQLDHEFTPEVSGACVMTTRVSTLATHRKALRII